MPSFFQVTFRQLAKHKLYAFIKVLGLAVGFAVFTLIVLYYQHEHSYEKWNPNYKRIFRVEGLYKAKDGTIQHGNLTPSDLGIKLQEAIPEIEYVSRFSVMEMGERLLTNEQNVSIYIDHILSSDSVFFEVFQYRFIYGDAKTSLSKLDNLVLTKKTAERLFGQSNPVGQKVKINANKVFIVSGVVDTEGLTSHFEFDAMRTIRKKHDNWNNFNFFTYVMLKNGSDEKATEIKASKALLTIKEITNEIPKEEISRYSLGLRAIETIHLHSHDDYEVSTNGSALMTNILLILAVLILVISFINYTNLSIVQATARAKEIALRKVTGASKNQIRWQFFFEQLVIVTVAAIVGLILLELVLPWYNNLFNLNLSLFMNTSVLLKLLAIIIGSVLLFAFVSGVYPTSLILHYPASLVLKGSFSTSNKGNWLRKSLLTTQFCISSVFIICLLVVIKQVHYMKSKDLGFNGNQVMLVKIHQDTNITNFQRLKTRLLQEPNIKKVSACNFEPGISNTQTQGREHKGQQLNIAMINVDFDYFDLLDIRLKEGRFFDSKMAGDSTAFILNETAVKEFGLKEPLKEIMFGAHQVVGVIKDFNQKKVDVPIVPTGFLIDGTGGGKDKLLIKFDAAHTEAVIKSVEKVMRELEPNYPMRHTFLNEEYAKLYQDHNRLEQLFVLFTIIIIIVTLVGLFAIAAYMVQQRTKELAVRKVLGATTQQLLQLLQRDFVKLALIGNLIAIPVSFWFINDWLKNFAYRIELPLLPFIITILLSFGITLLIVTIQGLQSARTKPVNALKYS